MNVSSHQFRVLRLFTKAKKQHEALSPSRVARAAGVSPATVKTLLDGRPIFADEFEKLALWNGLTLHQIEGAAKRLQELERRVAA